MIKSELVDRIAAAHGLYQRDAETALNAMLERITQALAEDGRVEIRGFGAFTSRTRGARTGRNPRTGAAVEVSEKRAPAFRAGKELRERLNALDEAEAAGGEASVGKATVGRKSSAGRKASAGSGTATDEAEAPVPPRRAARRRAA